MQLRQVRDFSQILGTSFTLYKRHFMPLLRTAGVICLPMAVAGGFLSGGTFAGIQRLQFSTGSASPDDVLGIVSGMLLTLVPGLLLIIAGWLLLVAMVHEYLRAVSLGEEAMLTPGELFKRGMGQFGSYFGASFLVGLLTLLGTFLCIVPGIYAYTVLSLALAAHAIERSGGSGSLGRSNQLVQGDFWPTLGLVVVVALINYLLNMVVQLPFTITGLVIGINTGMGALDPDGAAGLPSWYGVFLSISTAVQWCAQMLTYPLIAIAMVLKYLSRVEEKEGVGLRQKMEGFDRA